MRAFVDTNRSAYRLDRRKIHKDQVIKTWMQRMAQDNEIVISTQVLIELRAMMTRKLRPSMSAIDCCRALDALAQFNVVPTDASHVLDAHELAEAHRISWFDGLILEAAIRSHCALLYSEDFNAGQQFGSLAIIIPLQVA